MTTTKIATVPEIREYGEGDPVEIWIRDGRAVVRAYNECGNNYTDVDILDLFNWARGVGNKLPAIAMETRRAVNAEGGAVAKR